MDSIVLVALIAGCVSLSNGVLLAIMNRRWKKRDQNVEELTELKADIDKLFRLMDRLGAGLTIGLRNDKVIFKAFRNNSINGESEVQDKIMDEYFTNCAVHGFKTDREE